MTQQLPFPSPIQHSIISLLSRQKFPFDNYSGETITVKVLQSKTKKYVPHYIIYVASEIKCFTACACLIQSVL